MILALDLTPRQIARVLEQALRNRAKLEIEPRGGATPRLLDGVLEAREGNLLRVEVRPDENGPPLDSLIGSFCDVRMVLSKQLYLFSSCVIDVLDTAAPVRLTLAAPEDVQVANRRKFLRYRLGKTAQVRVWPAADAAEPFIGELYDVSRDGLACLLPKGEAHEALLLGDEVRLALNFQGAEPCFELAATVCNKMPAPEEGQWLLGVEFLQRAELKPALERLWTVLNALFTQSLNTEKNA